MIWLNRFLEMFIFDNDVGRLIVVVMLLMVVLMLLFEVRFMVFVMLVYLFFEIEVGVVWLNLIIVGMKIVFRLL